MKSIFSRITHHASIFKIMVCILVCHFIVLNGVLSQSVVTFAAYPNMPTAQINVVFHFLHDPRPGATDFTQLEAESLAALLITNANANFAAMKPCNRLGPNNTSNPHITDAKIRFASYGQGVFVYNHTNENMINTTYGNRVVNIVLNYADWPDCKNEGYQNAAFIRLCNIPPSILDNNNPSSVIQQTQRARLLCHEFGHVLGLKHSHMAGSECENIDISLANETANGNGNNIMSYGGESSLDPNNWNNAITPCQWGKMYNYIFNGDVYGIPQYVSWLSCNDYSDLTINSGQVEIWNTPRIITQNIVVKTGAYLKIATTVKMGFNCVISVERGAKLVIDGGKITKLCDEKWGGIFVWGNSTLEQPVANANSNSMQGSSEAGILYMYNNAILEYAYNAVANSRRDDGSLSWWDVIQYRGGVIYANSCKFRYNQRCAEFIKYRSPANPDTAKDKSIFFNGCEFTDSYWGVTAWDVNLEFNECKFFNNDEAILGWDASLRVVNSCEIKYNTYGINLYSTFSSSYVTNIGEDTIYRNQFDNRNNIRAYSYGGNGKLEIFGNEMFNIKNNPST